MNDNRVEELLIQLLNDMAVVKANLDSIEEIKGDAKKLEDKVDMIESTQSTHHRQIESLEYRQNTVEQFLRDNMNDSNKTQKGIFISAGLAVFGAIVSFVMNII